MSAGDVVVVGWKGGGSTPYIELAPKVTREPLRDSHGNLVRVGAGFTLVRKLTRSLIVPKVDVGTVLQGITVADATISASVPDPIGGVETVGYGGGWGLVTVDETEYNATCSMLSLVYEKTSSSFAEIGLPEGVTVTCASGVCYLKYGASVLDMWDSETACGSGLDLVWNMSRRVAQYAYNPNVKLYHPIAAITDGLYAWNIATPPDADIYCNDVFMETYEVEVDDLFVERVRSAVAFGGPYTANGANDPNSATLATMATDISQTDLKMVAPRIATAEYHYNAATVTPTNQASLNAAAGTWDLFMLPAGVTNPYPDHSTATLRNATGDIDGIDAWRLAQGARYALSISAGALLLKSGDIVLKSWDLPT